MSAVLDAPAAGALTVIPDAEHDRQRFIGGSDIAAVLGISPWTTPLKLFEKKTAPPREDGGNRSAKQRGHRWESVVAEMLVEHLEAEGHTVEIVGAGRRYRDADLPFLAAEIDFEILLDGAEEITNVELKTVHPFKMREWGDAGSDDMPVWYAAQVMHGLGVTRRRNGMLAALFGADELRAYPVVACDDTIAGMRTAADRFWTQHVLAGVAPEPTDLADLKRLYKGEVEAPSLIADDELQFLYLRARACCDEIKARESELETLTFQLQRAMKDAHELIVDERAAVTWKPQKFTTFDQAGLKELNPKLHRQFQRTGMTRVFKVK